MKKVIVVDYGLGNIHSAEQSLKRVVKENNQWKIWYFHPRH